jgi:hypothetical protein
MAKIEQRPKVECDCVIRLTEGEMRFLDALVGYGWDSFIKVFREKLGVSYIRDYEADGKALFEHIRGDFPSILRRANDAREVFVGTKEAKRPKPDPDPAQ